MTDGCLNAFSIKPIGMKRFLSSKLPLLFVVGPLLALGLAQTPERGTTAILSKIWIYLVSGGMMLVPLIFWTLRWFRATKAKARMAIVREERERLARELHDTLIQSCTGISVLLEAIASATSKGEPVQIELLNCAREQARRTIDEARAAVWCLRQPEKDIDLVGELHSLADRMNCNGKSVISVRHNVASLTVPASQVEGISMTVREAIQNAIRHSGTETILVDLRSDRRGLRVSVRDYGCGVSKTTKSDDQRHFGIVGMRERIRDMGGVLQINDMSRAGTEVELTLRSGSLRNPATWL